MANGEGFATQVPEVPLGAIGETIDDEQPSKAKQFFTDPKNLSTMLVLASMLAQPRRGGRTPLAHGLRSGVGALAFRGGLNQQIQEQANKNAEAQSITTARVAQAKGAEAQVAATTGRTETLERISGAEITSEEEIARLDREAGKFTPTAPAGGAFIERATLQAQKEFTDAMLSWEALGRQGPMPEYGSFLLRAMQGAALIGQGLPGQLDFVPALELPTSPDDEIVAPPPGPGVETTQIPKPTERETRPSLIANTTFAKDLRGERVAQAAFLKRKNPGLFTVETPDDEVFNTADRVDQQTRAQLETMTSAEAKEILKKFKGILPLDTLKAVRQVAGGKTFSDLPKTRN